MAGIPDPSARPPALLNVRTPAEVDAMEAARDAQIANANRPPAQDVAIDNLAAYIRSQWEMMRMHRNSSSGWNERLLHAQRVINGKYEASKLAQIEAMGGSKVYARITAVKCRGASSLLREVYLTQQDRPWGLDPTPNPSLPDAIPDAIAALVNEEVEGMLANGQPMDLNQIKDRTKDLTAAAFRAAKKTAREEAEKAEDSVDDKLVEGGFYTALRAFLTDLPIFPFACIKGPVVRIVSDLKWVNGKAVHKDIPKMFWERVSPFDIYFTPGVADIRDADVIERLRLTRADIGALIGVPGYDQDAIEAVLDEYGSNGLRDWTDTTDQQRAVEENRESPNANRSGMIDCLEFHGNVQGKLLLKHGFSADEVPQPLRDYMVQGWLIGRHVIKCQIAPSPRKRHPYYITSFEKVPGTPIGNALPDILEDIQDVCNACFRALVNNLALASGPQIVVNVDRLAEGQDVNEIYPHKRWFVKNDPFGNQSALQPVFFFQPDSRAQELLGIFEKMSQYGDELSAIPRYITGSERLGGAGRTASGLAMLMGNASKILQTVCSNIDNDVIEPSVSSLYDLLMLTDTSGQLRGDEQIRVRGVEVAVQRETNRQRQLEFLQITGSNPNYAQLIGPKGSASLLREIAKTIGLEGDDIVPSDDDIEMMMKMQQQMMQEAAAQQGMPGGPPGGTLPGGAPPQGGSQPAPQSPGLGVGEGKAMRGMAG